MKISGTDLVAWADRLDCRSSLPELVRRLIHGTIAPDKIELIDFPAGEGVQKHGVDGRLRVSQANVFVVAGFSVWEMGCSKDPQKKANDDYNTRKKTSGSGVEPATTTFVFVTPRRWYDHTTWSEEKRKEGLWADVRVLDADSLEQWLDHAPAARAWMSAMLGKPHEAQDLATWWTEWALRTDPPTSLELVRGKREDPWMALSSWLASPPSAITAQADDATEVAAYLYASAQLLPPKERDMLVDRTIVVSDNETLRRITLEGRGLIIVALECQVELVRLAAIKGHHVLRATAAKGARQPITLGAVDSGTMVAALERMNIAKPNAELFTQQSNNSIARLRELLGEARELDAELAPFLLVPAWNDRSEGDVALVSQIVGRDPEAVRELVRRATAGPKAVFVRTEDSVRWASHLAGWRALARALAPHDIARFKGATTQVLALVGPRYGGTLPHSSELRKGLGEALLMLATGADALGDNINGPDVADGMVATLLHGMEDWRQWATLDRFLPTLAEASPTAFIDGLRWHIEARPDLFRELLIVEPNALGNGGRSVGLVWALETLAWEPTYLPDATLLLADLAKLDPGGNYHPRPFDGLMEIFVPWMPHTTASLEQRIGALEALARHNPEIYPRVLLGLAQKESTSPTSKPSVRPWTENWQEGALRSDVAALGERLGQLAIETCECHPTLWAQLIPETRWLTPKVRAAFFERLSALQSEALEPAVRMDLSGAIRKALSFSRAHPDSKNAPSPNDLQILEQLLGQLESSDVREKYRWLFARGPLLPDVSRLDWKRHEDVLGERRQAAARELVASLTDDELLVFAKSEVEDRTGLGFAIARTPGHDLAVSKLLAQTLGSDGEWARELRLGLVWPLHQQDPNGFLASLRDAGSGRFSDLTAVQRAEICLHLSPTPEVWQAVDGLGSEARALYWRKMEPLGVAADQVVRVVQELLEVQRPHKALEAAGMRAHDRANAIPPELIVRVLEQAASGDPSGEPDVQGLRSYHVVQLLELLAKAGADWRPQLFEVEWIWVAAIGDQYHPTALYDELARNPDSFVEMVGRVFRAEGESRDTVPDEAAALNARHAWRLLEAWRTLPGLGQDGVIDSAHLQSWVQRARALLREKGRKAFGDRRVGAVLAVSPSGADNHWPHEAVRQVIESLNDVSHIEIGFTTGRFNQRGMVTKQFGEGGAQELSLAQSYETSAKALRTHWPTTARFLDRLASGYRSDARSEDLDAAMMAVSVRPAAYPEDRARVFAEELQSRSRYTFTLAELRAGASLDSGEAARAVEALVRESRLVVPELGFQVIVPIEYRSSQAPPPSWYLDDWMRFAKAAYYVGLLSAAALHGAASQQPQTFQVVVREAREVATVGRSKLEFIVDAKADEAFGVEPKKTDTGYMQVSSPERTLFDLVEHADEIGGIDLVAGVIEELGEACDDSKLGELAQHYTDAVVQRAGWILEQTGHAGRTQPLRDAVVARNATAVALRPTRTGGIAEDLWRVMADAPLEDA